MRKIWKRVVSDQATTPTIYYASTCHPVKVISWQLIKLCLCCVGLASYFAPGPWTMVGWQALIFWWRCLKWGRASSATTISCLVQAKQGQKEKALITHENENSNCCLFPDVCMKTMEAIWIHHIPIISILAAFSVSFVSHQRRGNISHAPFIVKIHTRVYMGYL